MSKSRSSRGVTVDELFSASTKAPRATLVRKWMLAKPGWVLLAVLIIWVLLVQAAHTPVWPTLAGIVAGVVGFMAWPVIAVVWRLRIEIASVVGLVAFGWLLHVLFSTSVVLVMFGLLVAAGAATPQVREFAIRQYWLVVTRHRLRGVLEIGRVGKAAGRVPFVIWSSTTPAGERIVLWLRSGAAFEDIDKKRQQIAAACWATEARAVRSLRWSHIVTVDVIRRDQLSPQTMVDPNLVTDNPKTDTQGMESADKYVADFLKESAAQRMAKAQEPVAAAVSGNGSKKKDSSFTSVMDDPF